MKSPLFIFPHLGLGDAIICNGMVRVLSDRWRNIVWFARRGYGNTILEMFDGLRGVSVVEVKDDAEMHEPWMRVLDSQFCLRLGHNAGGDFDASKFDQDFYRQADVPFEARWNRFGLPTRLLCNRRLEPQALFHDDPRRGFEIRADLLPDDATRMTSQFGFWSWMPELLSARELHCIDSAFFNLAESLYAIGLLRKTRLVWHQYARITGAPTVRAPWEIIK